MPGHIKMLPVTTLYLGQNVNYIIRPLVLISTFLFVVVRYKNPGTIPIVKAEIPLENNQIEV